MTVLENFAMKRMPFTNGIAVDSIQQSEQFTEALSRLETAAGGRLFALLTSPPGCGKSTLLRALDARLDPRKFRLVYISESKLTPRWLYNIILRQLGEKEYYYRGDGKKAVHEKFASIRSYESKEIAVIVDEAHLLSLETIQELRFFLNCSMDSENPVALILSGQTELKETLRRQCLDAVRQRINIIAELRPMDEAGTRGYVRSHLAYAGCTDPVFSEEALEAVHAHSKGIPRIVNQICTGCLLAAASASSRSIGKKTVLDVVKSEIL